MNPNEYNISRLPYQKNHGPEYSILPKEDQYAYKELVKVVKIACISKSIPHK